MTRKSDLSIPVEDPQGEHIEAAFHALHANRPDVALRYIEDAMPQALRSMLRQLAGEFDV